MRSYDFNITPKKATEMAQQFHNDVEVNGEIHKDLIVDSLAEVFGDSLAEWLRENIRWDEILENDLNTREAIEEREEARKGRY